VNNTTIKDVLLGIALALVAAYLFPAFLLVFLNGPSGVLVLFTGLPLLGLIHSYWLVIPLGVALGMLIPQIANGKNRWAAALQGAGFGAVGGLVSVYCFTSVFRFRSGLGVLWIAVIVYCALWVGGYASYRARGQSQYM